MVLPLPCSVRAYIAWWLVNADNPFVRVSVCPEMEAAVTALPEPVKLFDLRCRQARPFTSFTGKASSVKYPDTLNAKWIIWCQLLLGADHELLFVVFAMLAL